MGGKENQVCEESATMKWYRLGQLLVEATLSSPCLAFLREKKKSLLLKKNSNKKSLDFIDCICARSY